MVGHDELRQHYGDGYLCAALCDIKVNGRTAHASQLYLAQHIGSDVSRSSSSALEHKHAWRMISGHLTDVFSQGRAALSALFSWRTIVEGSKAVATSLEVLHETLETLIAETIPEKVAALFAKLKLYLSEFWAWLNSFFVSREDGVPESVTRVQAESAGMLEQFFHHGMSVFQSVAIRVARLMRTVTGFLIDMVTSGMRNMLNCFYAVLDRVSEMGEKTSPLRRAYDATVEWQSFVLAYTNGTMISVDKCDDRSRKKRLQAFTREAANKGAKLIMKNRAELVAHVTHVDQGWLQDTIRTILQGVKNMAQWIFDHIAWLWQALRRMTTSAPYILFQTLYKLTSGIANTMGSTLFPEIKALMHQPGYVHFDTLTDEDRSMIEKASTKLKTANTVKPGVSLIDEAANELRKWTLLERFLNPAEREDIRGLLRLYDEYYARDLKTQLTSMNEVTESTSDRDAMYHHKTFASLFSNAYRAWKYDEELDFRAIDDYYMELTGLDMSSYYALQAYIQREIFSAYMAYSAHIFSVKPKEMKRQRKQQAQRKKEKSTSQLERLAALSKKGSTATPAVVPPPVRIEGKAWGDVKLNAESVIARLGIDDHSAVMPFESMSNDEVDDLIKYYAEKDLPRLRRIFEEIKRQVKLKFDAVKEAYEHARIFDFSEVDSATLQKTLTFLNQRQLEASKVSANATESRTLGGGGGSDIAQSMREVMIAQRWTNEQAQVEIDLEWFELNRTINYRTKIAAHLNIIENRVKSRRRILAVLSLLGAVGIVAIITVYATYIPVTNVVTRLAEEPIPAADQGTLDWLFRWVSGAAETQWTVVTESVSNRSFLNIVNPYYWMKQAEDFIITPNFTAVMLKLEDVLTTLITGVKTLGIIFCGSMFIIYAMLEGAIDFLTTGYREYANAEDSLLYKIFIQSLPNAMLQLGTLLGAMWVSGIIKVIHTTAGAVTGAISLAGSLLTGGPLGLASKLVGGAQQRMTHIEDMLGKIGWKDFLISREQVLALIPVEPNEFTVKKIEELEMSMLLARRAEKQTWHQVSNFLEGKPELTAEELRISNEEAVKHAQEVIRREEMRALQQKSARRGAPPDVVLRLPAAQPASGAAGKPKSAKLRSGKPKSGAAAKPSTQIVRWEDGPKKPTTEKKEEGEEKKKMTMAEWLRQNEAKNK